MPVQIVSVAAFCYLGYYIAALAHALYMLGHNDAITEDARNKFYIAEWLGAAGLFFNWVFIFFMIFRLNDGVRHESNPNILSSMGYDEASADKIEQDISKEFKVNYSG